MSSSRALKAINLLEHDLVAHLENLDNPQFMQELVGYDPWENPRQAYADSYKALDIDWVIGIPGRSVRLKPGESGRSLADGTIITEWGMSGSTWRKDFKFSDVESVLKFDPVHDPMGEKLVSEEYTQEGIKNRRADQDLLGDTAIATGIYYTTLFQFGIMIFDWELFLSSAASEPREFQRILNGFAEISRRNVSLWVEDSINLFFMHDDIAIEQGMVFRPEWYREHVFPLYEYILEPAKAKKDLKIAFVSDGNYGSVLDDLVHIGFDGFVVNSTAMDLAEISRKFGDKIFLAGGIDTNILTLGEPEDVTMAVTQCLEKVRPSRGFFLHSGGDLPHNIPPDNLRSYFQATGRLDKP